MMNDHDTRRYEMLLRVREFGASHASAFPAGSIPMELLARIGAVVDELSTHAVTKTTGLGTTREGSAGRSQMRERLRRDLDAIVKTARSMARKIPNVDARFRIPRRYGDQTLIELARTFVQNATPLAAEFESRLMPANFIAKLEQDIDAFERALQVQRQGMETKIRAGAAIETTIRAGMDAVRELDSMVRNVYGSDPATLTLWARSIRVRRTASSPAPRPPDPVPAPAVD